MPQEPDTTHPSAEVAALRARVAALEERLARADGRPSARTEFQTTLYEAVVYALGRTLSLYDKNSVRVLIREIGRRLREYLEETGYHLGGAHSPEQVLADTVAFFVSHGFVELEVLRDQGPGLHARWHRLLGLRAYERIVAAGGETFISCPMNAVIHDALALFGKELVVRRKHFDLESQLVESWEEVVDLPPDGDPPPDQQLSLDPAAVLELGREQSRQLRLRDEFIRIASHELATPLTSMKLALKLLDTCELPPQAGRPVAVMRRQLGRLEQLVSEMLDTTRLQIGRLTLDRAPVDLVELTRNLVELLQGLGEPASAQIRVHAPASAVGRWDASRLDQVITNLLTNAMKYGRGRPIDVTLATDETTARLSVRDQGIGIDPAALERIFQPFERASPVEHYGGLGLGLYIAHRIVEMHGGTLRVESALGEGSTFTMTLPFAPDPEVGLLVERPGARRRS